MKKIIQYTLPKVAILTAIVSAALVTNYLFAAWSNPTANPTANNTPTPINVGDALDPAGSTQEKYGLLQLWNGLGIFGAVQLDDGGADDDTGKVLVSTDASGNMAWVSTSTLGLGGGGGDLEAGWYASCPAGWVDTGLTDCDIGDGAKTDEDSCGGGGGKASLCLNGGGGTGNGNVVTIDSVSVVSNSYTGQSVGYAYCPADTVRTGGGCDWDSNNQGPDISSAPYGSDGWRCENPSPDNGGKLIKAYAVCATGGGSGSGGSLEFSSIYTAYANGSSKLTTTVIGSSGDWDACYLTRASSLRSISDDEDEDFDCEVEDTGSQWKLTAQVLSGDMRARCSAQCVKGGGGSGGGFQQGMHCGYRTISSYATNVDVPCLGVSINISEGGPANCPAGFTWARVGENGEYHVTCIKT